MPDKNNNPLLSIAILTYNHGKFISVLLKSIIEQKVNFDYEIIIVDDSSTDNTREIINRYSNNYPSIFKAIFNEENKGVINNAIILSEECRGRYISFLDGDDYFIYDKKLQEQVDFLESNGEYIGCFHDAKIISTDHTQTESELFKKQHFKENDSYSSFNKYFSDFLPKHLINRNIIPTASLVFRNIYLTEFLNKVGHIRLSLNWAVHLYLIKGSKFKYFDQKWTVYNDHPGGVSKKNKYSEFIQTNIRILKQFVHFQEFKKLKSEFYRSLCREYKFLYHTTKKEKFPFNSFIGYALSFGGFCFYKLIGR